MLQSGKRFVYEIFYCYANITIVWKSCYVFMGFIIIKESFLSQPVMNKHSKKVSCNAVCSVKLPISYLYWWYSSDIYILQVEGIQVLLFLAEASLLSLRKKFYWFTCSNLKKLTYTPLVSPMSASCHLTPIKYEFICMGVVINATPCLNHPKCTRC